MKVRDMVLCALFAALMAVCAWISVQVTEIAFTLQTFAVVLTLRLLGGKRGTICIAVYLLLGVAGVPVFSGCRGGIGVLLGATGGYILGFLVWALVYWLLTAIFPKAGLAALVLGQLVFYGLGTAWFQAVYLQASGAIGLGAVLIKCVLPYLLPDAAKLGLALLLARRLKRYI